MNLLPNRNFRILGEGWGLVGNCGYEDYPRHFADCSVFLSCSKLEGGGPNALIEAMHANLIPVVSDTGNAREYIKHGYNGFIFPIDSKPEHIAELIERAYDMEPKLNFPFNDIWETVKDFTWPNYAKQFSEYLAP